MIARNVRVAQPKIAASMCFGLFCIQPADILLVLPLISSTLPFYVFPKNIPQSTHSPVVRTHLYVFIFKNCFRSHSLVAFYRTVAGIIELDGIPIFFYLSYFFAIFFFLKMPFFLSFSTRRCSGC